MTSCQSYTQAAGRVVIIIIVLSVINLISLLHLFFSGVKENLEREV